MDIEKLENDLRLKAEHIVQEVGGAAIDIKTSPTGEEFTEFACQFKDFETENLVTLWGIVIKGAKMAALLQFNGRSVYIGDKKEPKLYWRRCPKIKHIKGDMYSFYSRLLVTYNPELEGLDKSANDFKLLHAI